MTDEGATVVPDVEPLPAVLEAGCLPFAGVGIEGGVGEEEEGCGLDGEEEEERL